MARRKSQKRVTAAKRAKKIKSWIKYLIKHNESSKSNKRKRAIKSYRKYLRRSRNSRQSSRY